MPAAFRVARAAFVLPVLVASGCTSSQLDTNNGTLVYSEGGYAARHPELPQVVSQGGPVLHSPEVVAITFQPDPLAPRMATFVSQLAASSYWTQVTAEYGVGRLTALTPLNMASGFSGAFGDGDVRGWLEQQITSVKGFPQPDDETIYALFAPGPLLQSNEGTLAGYHSNFTLPDGRSVVYAVVSTSGGSLDGVTSAASHEIAEAATDPRPQDAPAFSNLDADDLGWERPGDTGEGLMGGEVGDVCFFVAVELDPSLAYDGSAASPGANGLIGSAQTPGVDGVVQRLWSNRAAAESHDPCQPYGLSPYFNSAPVLEDIVTATDLAGHKFSTRGVHIAVGQTRTLELDLFSDAPTTTPWKVEAVDTAGFCGPNAMVVFAPGPPPIDGGEPPDAGPFVTMGPPPPPCLTYSLDRDQGRNGDKLHLTVTVQHPLTSGSVLIVLQNTLDGARTQWPIVVAN